MDIDPKFKKPDLEDKPDGVNPRLEKWILRKAFDVEDAPYLPKEVLWRQKEQFSDGVGYNWVDGLKDYADQVGWGDAASFLFELLFSTSLLLVWPRSFTSPCVGLVVLALAAFASRLDCRCTCSKSMLPAAG